MNRLFFTSVFIVVLIGASTIAFAEGLLLFSNQNLEELTLITTDVEIGSFSFFDNYGEVQDGTVGDLIGIQGAKVLEVHEISIVVATYEEYEWYGTTRIRTNTQTIPKARTLEGGKGVR